MYSRALLREWPQGLNGRLLQLHDAQCTVPTAFPLFRVVPFGRTLSLFLKDAECPTDLGAPSSRPTRCVVGSRVNRAGGAPTHFSLAEILVLAGTAGTGGLTPPTLTRISVKMKCVQGHVSPVNAVC